jgi:tetratricopeptide (TPR) repeat protein
VIKALENFFISSTAKNKQIMKTHQRDIFSEFENALVNFKSSPSIPQYKHIIDLLLTLEKIQNITEEQTAFLKRMLHECVNIETSWSLFISHFLWTLNANHNDNFNDAWNCARWSGFTYKGSRLDTENHLKLGLELRQKNSNPVTFILLGNTYRALLRFREAEDIYLQGCTYWPNDPFLKLRLADLYLATFRYGLAEPILRFLHPRYPSAREMMFLDVPQESETPSPTFLTDDNSAIALQASKYEFTAFIAADPRYLEKYGLLYVQSMQKKHQDRVHFHIHIIHDEGTALPKETFELLKEHVSSISFSHRAISIPFENTNLMKSIYASERFLVLPYLLEKIQMPIVMTDIDIECLCDLRHFIHSNTQMDFCVIAPSKDAPEAWEHFNANCLLINPTVESVNAFKRISSNIIFQLNHHPLPWFVDQIALFREVQLAGKCRIEQLPIQLYDPDYKDAEKLKSSHFRIFHGSWF